MADTTEPREELRRDLPTNEVYHFVDEAVGVDVRSREVFKKRHEHMHYPAILFQDQAYMGGKSIAGIDRDITSLDYRRHGISISHR